MHLRSFLVASAGIVFITGCTAASPRQTADETRPPSNVRAEHFASAEAAKAALEDSVRKQDRDRLRAILGVQPGELSSGDQAQDKADFEQFAERIKQTSELVRESDTRMTLVVGPEKHPFPIPIDRDGQDWFFNTDAGRDEIMNRRIGANELAAIRVCRGYVAAQRDYAAEDWDGDHVMEYAERLASTTGQHDGLYWESSDEVSPLGPLVAEARAEGFRKAASVDNQERQPYHGYLYKVLTRQGSHAPGGAMNYIINGHMVAGFALVAYPARWNESGVMTFIVNANGVVYQKNLGERTEASAMGMTAYDPDESWQEVSDLD